MLPDTSTVAGTYGAPYVNAHQIEDSTTDPDADEFNELCADAAATTHTVDKAWVRFVGKTYSGSGTDSITVVAHDATWGNANSVVPTVTHTGSGTYNITWTTTYTDELGTSRAINIRKPNAWACATTGKARVWTWTSNSIRIETMTVVGGSNALNGITIFVEWG